MPCMKFEKRIVMPLVICSSLVVVFLVLRQPWVLRWCFSSMAGRAFLLALTLFAVQKGGLQYGLGVILLLALLSACVVPASEEGMKGMKETKETKGMKKTKAKEGFSWVEKESAVLKGRSSCTLPVSTHRSAHMDSIQPESSSSPLFQQSKSLTDE